MTPLSGAFLAVMAALGLAGWAFFRLSKNASLKRRLRPWYGILGSVLFFAYVVSMLVSMGVPLTDPILLVFVPALVLITVINAKGYGYAFCDACGATLFNAAWWSKARFCSKCGGPLRG